ncbi:MAG: hypothetical protein ACI8QS_002918, partial [Planctomycetota bacterium]
MKPGKFHIDKSLTQWSDTQGAATVTALLAVVALLGVSGAFLATSLRSQLEREGFVDEYAAIQVADAGVSLAMANLTMGNMADIGSDGNPWNFGSGDCQTQIVDNADGTFTIVSRSEVSGAQAAIEAVVAFSSES